jgi:MoxR-like ATPase
MIDVANLLRDVRAEVAGCVIGLKRELDLLLAAMLARRHVLLEGVPGLGKTLLAKSLAASLGCEFKRIQFTPDMLPADILGGHVYSPRTGEFSLRRGPIFTNILLADEINRAPAKTQSALLEVMQERQVTLEGETIALSPPFLVLATQNPLEHEGVYPLPQAQLDRFAMRVILRHPPRDEELDILRLHRASVQRARPVLDVQRVLAAQSAVEQVTVSDDVLAIIVDLVGATRRHELIALPGSPRMCLDLLHLGRARALLEGRTHVLPDDLKALFFETANHRLALKSQALLQGKTVESVIHEVVQSTQLA